MYNPIIFSYLFSTGSFCPRVICFIREYEFNRNYQKLVNKSEIFRFVLFVELVFVLTMKLENGSSYVYTTR